MNCRNAAASVTASFTGALRQRAIVLRAAEISVTDICSRRR